VNSHFLLFVRLILRPLRQEPLRTILTILAVALGIGVVIAIDLAGQAAAGSFHSSVETLTGSGDLLLTSAGGIDERVLGRLVDLPFDLRFSPRIEDFATLDGRGESFPFIGLDFVAAARSSDLEQPEFVENPIWVGPDTRLKKGQKANLLINDQLKMFTVAGVVKRAANAILVDIAVAQEVTGKIGKLDSIEVDTPPDHPVTFWRSLLQKQLPPSVSVEPTGSRTEDNQKMLGAFRLNLRVLSYIALVVGAFLIYNTISISVIRRRTEIGIVRALGGTQRLILFAFLAESLFFAVCGSVAGLFLGRFLAEGAVRLIGSTVEALYVSSKPAPLHFTLISAFTGIGLGLLVSVLAALAPALEASRVAPVETMARGREQFVAATRSLPRALLAGVLFVLAAVFSMLPPIHRQPFFAYLAVVLLVAGTAAIIPSLIDLFVRLFYRPLTIAAGVEGLVAARSLRASLGRSSILTAALAIAVAMTASVVIMVGSFRETVVVWMDNQLKADLYLRPAGSAAADQHPTMSPDIADGIARVSGVLSVDRFRAYPITYNGLPATLAAGETSRVENALSTHFLPGEDPATILPKLPTGDYAVVSEPFANKHRVGVNSILRLPLAGAIRQFKVLGVYYDYSTERGYIILDRSVLMKYLPDPAESNLAVYLKPGANPAAVRSRIDSVIAGRKVLVFTNKTLRQAAIDTFDRTFRITYALEVVAIVVAVMGIAGALLAMVIDRRRELGLLRFLGASRGQLRKIILCEAGLIGLLANSVGLVLGTVLSLILIFVINKQSFGWTIQFHWPVTALFGVLAGVYTATILAGLYPAHSALRMNPIEVVHDE
jgi:putative ABC transport system permease protein